MSEQQDAVISALEMSELEAAEALLNGDSASEAILKAFAPEPKEKVEDTRAEEVKDTNAEESTPKYDKLELLAIFDKLIFEGSYKETVAITKGRLSATYRTRTASESNTINATVDRMNFTTIVTMQNHQTVLTLSYALIDYSLTDSRGKTTLKTLPKDPRESYKIVSEMPEAVIEALSMGLNTFDNKIRATLQEAEQSF